MPEEDKAFTDNLIARLNRLEHKLHFYVEEESYGLRLRAVKGQEHFGAFEITVLFSDYKDKETACREFGFMIMLMISAAKLTNPKAFHNM